MILILAAVITIFWLLIYIENPFQYFLKIFYLYLSFIIIPILTIPLSLFTPKNITNAYYLVNLAYWIRVPLGLVWKRIGNEGSALLDDENSSCVVVMNHQHSLDVFSLFEVWPRRFVTIQKKELLYAGPFGIVSYLVGTVFVDRKNPEQAKQATNDLAACLVKEKLKVGFFPEGTRRMGDELLPFKKGAFHLAVKAQVPIVPVVFSSYREFLDPHKKIFSAAILTATILPPVSTKGKTEKEVDQLVVDVRNKMNEVYQRSLPKDLNANE